MCLSSAPGRGVQNHYFRLISPSLNSLLSGPSLILLTHCCLPDERDLFLKCMARNPQTTVTVNQEARGSRQKLAYNVAALRFIFFLKQTECLLMVHELTVFSKIEFFHTECMDTVSSLLLSPPSLFLSSPLWGASVLAWSNHPQQEFLCK